MAFSITTQCCWFKCRTYRFILTVEDLSPNLGVFWLVCLLLFFRNASKSCVFQALCMLIECSKELYYTHVQFHVQWVDEHKIWTDGWWVSGVGTSLPKSSTFSDHFSLWSFIQTLCSWSCPWQFVSIIDLSFLHSPSLQSPPCWSLIHQ
jgi:hypothetical protein